jgi:hypothetical protein
MDVTYQEWGNEGGACPGTLTKISRRRAAAKLIGVLLDGQLSRVGSTVFENRISSCCQRSIPRGAEHGVRRSTRSRATYVGERPQSII